MRTGVLAQAPLLPGLPEIASKLLPLAQARDLYHKVLHEADGFQLEKLLAEMRTELRVDPADLSRIPAKGPVVAVSNHPFGILDGAVLAVLLSRIRADVKVMANSVLAGIPDLERSCIFVDPFGGPGSAEINRRALKQAIQWLSLGGMLGIFPAGEVSHWRLPEGEIVGSMLERDRCAPGQETAGDRTAGVFLRTQQPDLSTTRPDSPPLANGVSTAGVSAAHREKGRGPDRQWDSRRLRVELAQ